LSNTTKLSVLKSVFILILTNNHESWVITERVISQAQAAKTKFLQRFHGVRLRDKVHSCDIRKAFKSFNQEQQRRLFESFQTQPTFGNCSNTFVSNRFETSQHYLEAFQRHNV